MAHTLRTWAINRGGKNSVRNLRDGPETRLVRGIYFYSVCFFLREYTLGDGKVSFPVNLTLQGDVTIVVYHGRSTLGGKVQGKMTSMRVFMLQFHTGFIKTSAQKLKYSRYELRSINH